MQFVSETLSIQDVGINRCAQDQPLNHVHERIVDEWNHPAPARIPKTIFKNLALSTCCSDDDITTSYVIALLLNNIFRCTCTENLSVR